MPDLDFVDNVEEGDDSSDAGFVSEYRHSGTVLEQNDQTHDVLSVDARRQCGERSPSIGNNLIFQPLPLPRSPSLVDSAGDLVSSNIQIQAYLRGRFSHFDQDRSFNNSGTVNGNPEYSAENHESADGKDTIGIIFYRRNKFKVLGSVSIPARVAGIKHRNSQISLISSLYVELDAIDSLEGVPVRLISSSPKEKGTATASASSTRKNNSKTFLAARTADGLPRISLRWDRNESGLKSKEDDTEMPVPICWEKLQFRHATAKKRGTWQYFYLRLTVTAILEDGKSCVLGRSQSSAITVRGRSPQSFPSHLNKAARNGDEYGQSTVTQSHDAQKGVEWRNSPEGFPQIDCQSALDAIPDNLFLHDFSDFNIWNNNLQWQDDDPKNQREIPEVNQYINNASPPVDDSTNNGYNFDYNSSLLIPSLEAHLLPSVPNLDSIFNLPNSLSLSSEYSNVPNVSSSSFTPFPTSVGDHRTITDVTSKALNFNDLGEHQTERQNSVYGDGSDEADDERRTYSYEYIPLSINDWTVPVDAVYRPHGVHARQVANVEKSVTKKRYFLSVK